MSQEGPYQLGSCQQARGFSLQGPCKDSQGKSVRAEASMLREVSREKEQRYQAYSQSLG